MDLQTIPDGLNKKAFYIRGRGGGQGTWGAGDQNCYLWK